MGIFSRGWYSEISQWLGDSFFNVHFYTDIGYHIIAYILPLLGGFISDAFVGRWAMVVFLLLTRICGMSCNLAAATLDTSYHSADTVGPIAMAGYALNLLSTFGEGSLVVLCADQFEISKIHVLNSNWGMKAGKRPTKIQRIIKSMKTRTDKKQTAPKRFSPWRSHHHVQENSA